MSKKLFVILSLVLFFATALAQEHTDHKDKGIWFAVQASESLAYAGNSTNAAYTQMDLLLGYRFSEFFKIGIGVSPRLLLSNAKYSTSFPAAWLNKLDLLGYLDLRGNIVSQESRKAVPYWNVDLGYKPIYGAFASPTIGYRFGSPKSSFLVGVTYTYQYIWGVLNIPVHSVGLKLGYEF